MKPTDLAQHLTCFLGQYLPAQRMVSPHTIQAYRDTFTLLLCYFRDVRGITPDRLQLGQIDDSLVLNFLEYIQQERHCSIRTRNHRLAILHAFFRYIQTKQPHLLLQCQRILAIPFKQCVKPTITYLLPEALKTILAQPDLNTPEGRRDALILSLLYDTGARVQELIDLCVQDIYLKAPPYVRLLGKGRKLRAVPLMEPTVCLLREYLKEQQLNRPEQTGQPLFSNRSGLKLSRSGVRYILKKYTNRAKTTQPQLPESISPHVLRHSKAMHLLQAGVPLIIIRNILGHADLKTTEIYAKADLKMKRQALEKVANATPVSSPPAWQTNKDLLNWLRSL